MTTSPFKFTQQASCPETKARAGLWSTPHGVVETPRFMPVGTVGTVKGLTSVQLQETDAQMILANTYHLHLQPGEEIIEKAGGFDTYMLSAKVCKMSDNAKSIRKEIKKVKDKVEV